ncbi:hypothetical protein [Methanothrix harundinacea]|uniref:Uncharacterized protein n=1 Tax=Methanothrix harundinacea (strain 6Ac) TaxID=1110509 RepID=G7WK90_METH6|nr:hypothetical protein [Methanothrix harundinacea]AET64083.1 hypothetical protein Mhar_0705 [Methanothrix harundinacea 6Ac]
MASPEDKARAAAKIRPRSLEEARGAVEARGLLFLRRLDRLEAGLARVGTGREAERFGRATAMFLLDSLPLRPEACPFCVQNAGANRCGSCGYAETHGGECDAETSAFGQLIEAVVDLAGEIHEIRDNPSTGAVDPEEAKKELEASIARSREAAERLLAEIAGADVSGLMEAKRAYIGAILEALPAGIIGSPQVDRAIEAVRAKLVRYW